MRYDIDNILDKYWEGTSSLEEENVLKEYFNSSEVQDAHLEFKPLFNFFKAEAESIPAFEPDLSFTRKKQTKVRFLLPKLIAIAASFVLLFSVSQQWLDKSEDTMYKNKFTELEDPEEALAITLEALGFVSSKIDKGTKDLTHIKEIEKTAVFKFDK